MKKLTVKLKLSLGFGGVALITLIVGTIGFLELLRIKALLREINGVRLPGAVAVAHMQGNMWAIQRFERILLYEKDPEIIKRQYAQLEQTWEKVGRIQKNYESLPKTREEEQVWGKIAANWEAWKALHQTVVGLIRNGEQTSLQYAHALSYGKTRTVFLDTQEKFSQLLHQALQVAAQAHQRAETLEYRARILLAGCTLAGVLAVLCLGLFATQSIQKSYEALQKSENWFSTTLRSIGDAVIATDSQGQITFMNAVAEALTGWSPHEAWGRPVEDVFQIVNEETGAPVENPVARVIREGLVVGLANHTILIAKDGTRLPINDSGAPIKDEQGDVIGAVLVFQDITELKEAMWQLRRSEQEFRVMVNNIPGIVFTGYADGSIEPIDLHNDKVEPLTGYSKADFDYRHLKWTDLIIKEDLDEAKKVFLQALKSDNKSYVREYRIRHREGKEAWIQERSQIICDESGRVDKISGILFDITGRQQAEEEKRRLESQLIQVQRMEAIGTLAGGIAHDFNNILSALLGYTELALEEVPEGTETRANLMEVLQAGVRAKDLVKQILTFSRQDKQEMKPVQASLVIKEALKLLRASLPTTIAIRQNLASPYGKVLANPTQIHQVLMNLCTNAAQAMEEKGGILEVNLEEVDLRPGDPELTPGLPPGPYLRLTVSDTGKGMTPEVMARIFEPFFTTKKPGEGSGMGLAVVHGIVKSHNGDIRVFSEPGKGSTFRVYLPRVESPEATETAVRPEAPKGQGRILFVDDEESLVRLGQQMLTRLGYEVVGKTGSLEALETFRAQPDKFDLVITDLTMPHLTGIKLAEELLRLRPDLPIILCTGFTETIKPEEAQALGIRGLITKPLVKTDLAVTVRKVLEGKD